MSKSENYYWKGFLTGATIGGLAAAVTALLLAPKSGKELRKDLVEKSTELYEKASDLFVDMESSVNDVVSSTLNEGKTKAQNIITNAKQKAEDLLENADKVLQDAKSKAASLKDNVSYKIDTLKDAAKAGADAFKTELNNKETI